MNTSVSSKTKPFYSELRKFILSVIRQRKHLVKTGASKANKMLMLKTIEQLENQLNFYRFNSDVKISKFFLRNKAKIRILLPGEGSSCHLKREEEYYLYLSRAEQKLSEQ